jgi:hypothetical protein
MAVALRPSGVLIQQIFPFPSQSSPPSISPIPQPEHFSLQKLIVERAFSFFIDSLFL